jgi:hypothetical protein
MSMPPCQMFRFTAPKEPDPPLYPLCRVTVHSGYSEFKNPWTKRLTGEVTRGDRASITTFSSRSRNNLLKKLFSLPISPSVFITLTYPNFYPADSKEWKRHLDNFRKELLNEFPDAWLFWKLEPQRKGAPHYHLLGSLNRDVNIFLFRQFVAELWYRVCGRIDPKHLKAGQVLSM